MEYILGAAKWVVGKALAPFTDNLLEDWAASKDLSTNVDNLKDELLLVQIMLNGTRGKEIKDPKLEELLQKLRDLAYDADDVLDELEYFRIQDELDGTSDAANEYGEGWANGLVRNAFHTAKAFGHQLWLPVWSSAAAVLGNCLPSSSLPPVHDSVQDQTMPGRESLKETPKLVFNRVDVSKRMKMIVKQLQPLRKEGFKILGQLGYCQNAVPDIVPSRPATISESIEPKLYGRDSMMKRIIYDITQGKHCGENLTVLPIVGQGGIGKTTLTQYIYQNQKVKEHFDVKVWTCISRNFNVNKLMEEIVKSLGIQTKGTAADLIVQRLNPEKEKKI